MKQELRSEQTRGTQMKRQARYWIVGFVVFVTVLFISVAIFLPQLARMGSQPSPMFCTTSLASLLWVSVEGYKSDFGSYPTGNNAHILQVLQGDNTKKTQYLVVEPGDTNALGQCIDGWGTPFEFTAVSTNALFIRSAGPNRVFGDVDDVMYPSSTNNLPIP